MKSYKNKETTINVGGHLKKYYKNFEILGWQIKIFSWIAWSI